MKLGEIKKTGEKICVPQKGSHKKLQKKNLFKKKYFNENKKQAGGLKNTPA